MNAQYRKEVLIGVVCFLLGLVVAGVWQNLVATAFWGILLLLVAAGGILIAGVIAAMLARKRM